MSDKIDQLRRAKYYLEQLAQGYDPISGMLLPDDSMLNHIQIVRCFIFVSDILRQVIENGGEVIHVKRRRDIPFRITAEQKSKIVPYESSILISDFTNLINAQVDIEKQGRLKASVFGDWLVMKGYLQFETRNDVIYKCPTDAGREIGIHALWRDYNGRGYYRISYSREAQQFLLDRLDTIIQFAESKKEKAMNGSQKITISNH